MENLLQNAKNYSQFLSRWLTAFPSWETLVEENLGQIVSEARIQEIFRQEFANFDVRQMTEEQVSSTLRSCRQKVMLWMGARDLNDLATLDEIMAATTVLAESSLAYAMQFLEADLSKTYGLPHDSVGGIMKLWVLGMGKLGGRELNVSSDIDLIFVYDHDGQTTGGPKSLTHHEWFSMLGKKMIRLLSESTDRGFVFRVDMRLRPNGDSGPLVSSIKMLEEYFIVQGREWERYAWIKSRLVYPLEQANNSGLPRPLEQVVRSFVYRRFLDYGVINSIRDLHAQIRHEANLRATQYPERASDVKLGVGGIREIEFLAQMFQLIRGGQEPDLRARPTLQVLQNAQRLGLIDPMQQMGLDQAYHFLRKLEHRLQWRNDAQIHYVPKDQENLGVVAKSMGFENSDQFTTQLERHQSFVAKAFAEAFALDEVKSDQEVSIGTFEMYPKFRERFEHVRQTQRYQLMSTLAKKNLELILLKVLDKQPPVAETTLIRFLDFLESVFRRSAYLSLLTEYPIALQRLIYLMEVSSWGSSYLIRHPQLLDELLLNNYPIDPEKEPDLYWSTWQENLCRKLEDAQKGEDAQERMWNIFRDAHHGEIFQILLADLGIGRIQPLPVEAISDRLSRLADIIIQETLSRIWSQLIQKFHCTKPFQESGFGVIAYGKLGGKELGYGSDLDLVFIYDETRSPLPVDEQVASYIQLSRKFILWLTTATSSGNLYEIDTRLRPNGEAGLMVSSMQAFAAYQRKEGSNSAWLWEHQALTRARFCVGDPRIGDAFDSVRREVLTLDRDQSHLRSEIVAMRKRIHDGHPNLTDDFDLKHDQGGMVDIEFMIQYCILAHAKDHPKLLDNLGNIGLLKVCAKANLMPAPLANQVADAYRTFRKLQHQLRLDGNTNARVPSIQMTSELDHFREDVRQLWEQLMCSAV